MAETPLESGAGSATGPGAAGEALRTFLDAGEVRCPSCGYDVHGCDGVKCPECAWPLTLQLKPRVSFVPYWVFSLLINGWLFLWGTGGTLTTALRVWEYHSVVSRRFASNASQLQGNAQQLIGPANAVGGAGGPAGNSTTVVSQSPNSLGENLWMYFLGQNLLDQVSVTLFLISCVFGALGLALTPWMRRVSPRACAWMISASVVIFIATMVNYAVIYATYLLRAL